MLIAFYPFSIPLFSFGSILFSLPELAQSYLFSPLAVQSLIFTLQPGGSEMNSGRENWSPSVTTGEAAVLNTAKRSEWPFSFQCSWLYAVWMGLTPRWVQDLTLLERKFHSNCHTYIVQRAPNAKDPWIHFLKFQYISIKKTFHNLLV